MRGIRTSRNYVDIYSKNVDRLGILRGNLPEQIPSFYTLVNSILEDVDALHRGEWDEQDDEFFLRLYRGMCSLLDAIIRLGAEIRREIDLYY